MTLIAVSKRQPDDRLLAAYEAGHRDFGENYVQELVRKRELLPEDARWHLIGHLQTNKAKHAVGAHLIHTVDSARVARALDRAADVVGLRQPVLIEVNLADESSKAGAAPSEVSELVKEIKACRSLALHGLMCIPPIGEGRPYFAALRELRRTLSDSDFSDPHHLSMGMSGDFEAAVEEGATIVRVGTSIFGERE